MSSIKTVLATLALLGSATLAQAQGFDPNLANRYPSYAEPGVYGYSSNGSLGRLGARSLQSRDVSLPRQTPPSVADELWMERASQSFSGGGY